MIWPGRNLAVLLLAPALMSLMLLAPGAEPLRFGVLAVDAVIAIVALGDLTTLIGAGRFQVARTCGSVASLNEPHLIELTITHRGRRPRTLRLRDDVPESFEARPGEFLVRIPPRGQAVLDYHAVPKQRGTYRMRQVYALVASRLGLWQRAVSWRAETVVRVYPDVRQIARYTILARRDRLSVLGLRRSRRLGTDNEFERLRDYAEGDEPRHIDWRASARRRKLTVRDYQVNQSQRILFLVDCGRMMAGDTGGGLSPLDHAFNAMLLLAHVALIKGDQVGLLAFADRLRAYVPPGGGRRQINRMVHGVHNVFPELVEPRYDRAFVELERRCRKRSLVVLMTNVFDDVNAQQVADHLRMIHGRHLPLGVFLRDHDLFALADQTLDAETRRASHAPSEPHPPIPFHPDAGYYQGAAAAAMLNWREQVIEGLRWRGILMLDAFPDELTAPLVNTYLEIKARHLL